LLTAAPYGYQLVKPEGGDVVSVFGQSVPLGPLDNVAHLQTLDAIGRPQGSVTLPIEVKNIRHWIYPDSSELYELLAKAALLQLANPDVAFMPTLVCRRVHYTTFRMAKDLGFFMAQTRAQFVLPYAEVTQQSLEELRHELGFIDLIATQQPHRSLTNLFTRTIPSLAQEKAATFAANAEMLSRFSRFLRLEDSQLEVQSGTTREQIMNELREEVRTIPSTEGGW
jgi:hypothetical protein